MLRGEQSAGPRVVRENLSGCNVEGVIDRCWGTGTKHLSSESLLFTKQIPLFSGVGAANPFAYRTQRSKSKITDKTDNTAYFSILFLVPGEMPPSLGNGKKALLCSAPRGWSLDAVGKRDTKPWYYPHMPFQWSKTYGKKGRFQQRSLSPVQIAGRSVVTPPHEDFLKTNLKFLGETSRAVTWQSLWIKES